jgi:uncharacterized protein YutE (UPF0331/DUF86 family)
MTPRSLDRDTLALKLRMIRELLDDLEQLRELTAQDLERDRIRRYAVERILTRIVDLAVSINGHIGAATLAKGPADYRDSFVLAAQAGAISAELATALQPSVGPRNILTHEYATVDPEIVAGSIRIALRDYRTFVGEIARFLAAD